MPKQIDAEGVKQRKGVSPLLASVLLVMISIVIATMVSSFVTNMSSERTKRVQNLTQARLACQYASLYVTNVTYDCNSDCFTGSPYRINATLQNSGSSALEISGMQINLDNGEGYTISVNSSSLGSGSILTKNFNNILVNSSPLMPIGTMDIRNAYVNDTNAVALWHFDGGTGNSAADSAGGNTGTISGASWNSSGRFSTALTFDGINDFINVSDSSSLNLTTAYAIEAWININSLLSSSILDKDNGYAITLSSSGILSVWHNGTIINSTSALSVNAWYHIAATYNGNAIKLYINGAENASSTGTISGLSQTARNLYIGANNSANTVAANTFFNGTIDEVRISNVTRNFTAILNYTVSHPNIAFVRLFNQSGQQEATTSNLNGISYYSNQLVVNTAADYRIEMEDTSGSMIEKWYPYRQGGSCKKTTNLDKIVFSVGNCPETTDTFYGSDVTFVNCV